MEAPWNNLTFTRTVDVAGRHDVIVVGGGPAGIAAAVSAARTGASTLLLERYGALGGNLTIGNISPILGSVSRGTMYDEVVSRLAAGHEDDEKVVTRNGREVHIDPDEAKGTLARLVAESGARVLPAGARDRRGQARQRRRRRPGRDAHRTGSLSCQGRDRCHGRRLCLFCRRRPIRGRPPRRRPRSAHDAGVHAGRGGRRHCPFLLRRGRRRHAPRRPGLRRALPAGERPRRAASERDHRAPPQDLSPGREKCERHPGQWLRHADAGRHRPGGTGPARPDRNGPPVPPRKRARLRALPPQELRLHAGRTRDQKDHGRLRPQRPRRGKRGEVPGRRWSTTPGS